MHESLLSLWHWTTNCNRTICYALMNWFHCTPLAHSCFRNEESISDRHTEFSGVPLSSKKKKSNFKQLTFCFIKMRTNILAFIFTFYRAGAGCHIKIDSRKQNILCAHIGEGNRGVGCLSRIGSQTVTCCGQDSPWLCLSKCEASVCSSVDWAAQGSPLLPDLSWRQKQTDTL